MEAKTLAKRWMPPALLEALRPVLKRGIYFSGMYPDWKTARNDATGYDAEQILDSVRTAVLMVKHGEAGYERDSVVFDEVQHSFPVLAGLLRAAIDDRNRLSVLDFGGSLGSSYFQCRKFLSVLPSIQWSIVEQENFVRCGQEQFETGELRFFHTIQECHQQMMPNVALLSSVLQYVPEPYRVLEDLINLGIPYIVIDRTPFAARKTDCTTIQYIPSSIYAASLPFRIFSESGFADFFLNGYEVIARFDSTDGRAMASGQEFRFGGIFLRKI
jgi:putative methyltransferase (TIGR04325 family)